MGTLLHLCLYSLYERKIRLWDYIKENMNLILFKNIPITFKYLKNWSLEKLFLYHFVFPFEQFNVL